MFVAAAAVLINVFIGMIYGMVSGYFGGKVDNLMQRFQEIVNSIPYTCYFDIIIVIDEAQPLYNYYRPCIN